MDLSEIRKNIDQIDEQLVSLFCHRMNLSAQVAAYKKANHMPIYVPAREREILNNVAEQSGPEMGIYVQTLYETIFELSRNYQSIKNAESTQ